MRSTKNQLALQDELDRLVFPLACLICISDEPTAVRALMLRLMDCQVRELTTLAETHLALTKGGVLLQEN